MPHALCMESKDSLHSHMVLSFADHPARRGSKVQSGVAQTVRGHSLQYPYTVYRSFSTTCNTSFRVTGAVRIQGLPRLHVNTPWQRKPGSLESW